MGKNRIILIVSVIILAISLVFLLLTLFPHRDLYLERFEPKSFEKMYLQSQWVISGSKNLISDESLYAYAGYRYIRGLNPILLNPEMPPLGKYLIGVSILLFSNQNIATLLMAIFSLVLLFFIVYLTTTSPIAASMAVLLSATHTSFIEQLLHTPQLDIFQLFFFLLFLLFFILFQKTNKLPYLIISGIVFGAFISIKFFLPYFFILNFSVLIYFVFRKFSFKKILVQLSILNLIAIITFTATYAQYFVLGGTLRKFLGVQKWIVLFYLQSKIDMTKLIGNYLFLIFFNKWKFWFETYSTYSYQYWTPLWPIIFTLGSFSGYKLIRSVKKKENHFHLVFILISFLLIYNIFLLATPIYPRYLLLLFMVMNILISIYFSKMLTKWLKR